MLALDLDHPGIATATGFSCNAALSANVDGIGSTDIDIPPPSNVCSTSGNKAIISKLNIQVRVIVIWIDS